MYFPAKTILAETESKSEFSKVCLYCSAKRIKVHPVFTSQLSNLLHSVRKYNYEIAFDELYESPFVGYVLPAVIVGKMFRKDSCYQYPEPISFPESICTFHSLAKRFNFTNADPTIATEVFPAIVPAETAIF